MASDHGSAVESQVHDNHHWVDPRQLYADANSIPSSRKSAPLGNLPAVVTPIFYDLFLRKLVYDKFCCRFIRPSDLADVASNYAYSLFNIGQLQYSMIMVNKESTYKCKFCDL